MELPDSINEFVDGNRAVKIADENPYRKVINIWAGDSDLYYGNRRVEATGFGHRIPAGGMAELTDIKAEIWVKRASLTSGLCSFSEENIDG